MRPKVVIACVLLAVAILAVMYRASTPTAPASNTAGTEDTKKVAKAAPKAVTNHTATSVVPTNRQDHAVYVEKRIEELEKLAMNNDKNSMLAILQELNNPDKEIRTATLEALKQFRSRDAIPALQEQANRTDDPREKTEILDTIEWLKLPTFSEYRAQAKAKRDADKAAGIEPPVKQPRPPTKKGMLSPAPVAPAPAPK